MKWIGISALCLSVSLSGFYVSFLCRKRIAMLKLLSELFSELSSLIELTSVDITEIIGMLAEREQFFQLKFLKNMVSHFFAGCNIREIWCDSVMNIREIYFPYGRGTELLLSFSECLGKYSKKEFNEKCKGYSSEFLRLWEKEEEKWEKNRTLVSISGTLAAAFVFLTFI